MSLFDFGGWATRNDLKCSDGRTIRKDAFKHNDGQKVPLVWNHQHNDPMNVLGHALLENRAEGVYAHCRFNDTEAGKAAKLVVEHGDVSALSIYANGLKHQGADVMHGAIREVSLVIAGANPGAFIDSIMKHGETVEGEAVIYTGCDLELSHADKPEDSKESKKETPKEEPPAKDADDTEETVADVFNSMTEKQQTVVYAMIGEALSADEKDDTSEGGNNNMKHNIFDKETEKASDVLSHSAQTSIVELAKNKSVGSLQNAISMYAEENDADELKHGIDDIDTLFPDSKNLRPGAPEVITNDRAWVDIVMSKASKSPFSRIRTRQADIRQATVSAKGYGTKGAEKTNIGNLKLVNRTTDPTTIYVKDALNRDDIVDITDFDAVTYQHDIMRGLLHEEIAIAAMLGDGREEGDSDKIDDSKMRPIWLDDELYTIHADIDIEAAKNELQGSDTSVHFGENYIYAEALITAALYAREQYKGKGKPDFFCATHVLNKALLARDLNGRRIYDSASDLAKALNVGAIYDGEQFDGKTRTTTDSKVKKLLGIFVNMGDYNFGATKGGQITNFNQFDIDFNLEKMLIETRLSGALTRIKAAIALEEDVTPVDADDDTTDVAG